MKAEHKSLLMGAALAGVVSLIVIAIVFRTPAVKTAVTGA